MLLYSILMLLASASLFFFSIMIYRGKSSLIHEYHQERVKDLRGYCRAFGRALALVSAAPLFSGIIALFGESLMLASILVLLAVLGAGIACIIAVQHKYNGGVF